MFTGIVQDIGEITAIDKKGDWIVTIAAGKLPLERMTAGASVSCNGICLTVIDISPIVIPENLPEPSRRQIYPESHLVSGGEKTKWDSGSNSGTLRASRNLSGMTGGEFKVQLSTETLGKTTARHWKQGSRINLEPSLHAGDELGGHLVSGHIDGIARLKDKRKEGDSLRCLFEVPHEFVKYIAPKGSVALDGISLTVNEVEGPRFGVNLIPHTQAATTLGALDVGGEVNFEIDPIARYTARMISSPLEGEDRKS